MAANNFEMEMKHMLSQNTMRSPTQKDFNFMFQWLYHRIDPSYRFQKGIDQEVPPILATTAISIPKVHHKEFALSCGITELLASLPWSFALDDAARSNARRVWSESI